MTIIDFGISEILNDEQYANILDSYGKNDFARVFRYVRDELCAKPHTQCENLEYFINVVTHVDDFNDKMALLIANRNNKIKELLSDNDFFDLVKHNNILNFEWTFFLGANTKKTNGLFFEEFLQKSNLVKIPNKKSYLANKIVQLQKKLKSVIKKTNESNRVATSNTKLDIF